MSRLDPDLDIIIDDGTIESLEEKIERATPANAGPRTTRPHSLDRVTKKLIDAPETVDPKELAKQELARRELARRHFLPFVTTIVPNYTVEWFHQDLAARLERFVKNVEAGRSPRMLINVPPRRGKSEQASKALPAWFLGRNPDKSIIATTHSDDLANDNSRDVLNYITSEAYRKIFPNTTLNKDNRGATGWRTDAGGRYKPAGVGKGISGRGADIFLIDDPHRDKDAYSPAVRDAIWRWFKSSARTRLMPGGGMIIIQTRWVLDDLTGRVLEEEGTIEEGGKWEHICYPEEAVEDEYRLPSGTIVHEPVESAVLLRRKGECLTPKRYPPESNLEHKRDPVTWAALYQQNPVAGDSAEFTEKGMIHYFDELPRNLVYYSTWDLAVGQKERNDWTVGFTFGVDAEDNIYVVHMHRGRYDSHDLVELMIDNHKEYATQIDGVEKGHIQMSIGPFLERRIDERRAYGMNVEPLMVGNRDKLARARSIQGRMRQGKVFFPRDAAWMEDVIKELLSFPGGKHDDIVDALAWIGLLLDEVVGPRKLQARKKTSSWRNKLKKGRRGPKNWLAA